MSINVNRVRQVECPECSGSRHDDDRNCPTCAGRGEVGRDRADAYLESILEGLAKAKGAKS